MGWTAALVMLAATACGADPSASAEATADRRSAEREGWSGPPGEPARLAPHVSGVSWREAPELVALFAPVDTRASAYRAYVAPVDLDDALRGLASDPVLLQAPESWVPRALAPVDAFGLAGRYDRSRLARLYGARRPRVARGVRLADAGAPETWTLISPYPDPGLRRLETGTLALVLRR